MVLAGGWGDTSTVASRLTSKAFIGRSRELAELEEAASEAASGRPRVVLLGGDSGVGKTRLVGELETRLAARDMLVLRGETIEQGDDELPYAPLTGALRSLVRAGDPALEQLTPASRSQLSVLLPGLAEASPALEHGERSQLLLFEALLELIDVLSGSRPLVLVLEDMHWADRSTSTFVSFLARALRDEPLMVLITYRTDELHRRHPLRPLLSELERLDCVRRVSLRPFDRGELGSLLEGILGDAPELSLVDRLYQRSEGNALYTEELLAAGLDGRGAAPESLRDAFMLRVEQLSPEAQQVARTIAAARRVDEETLATVTSLAVPAVQAALRESMAEQIVVAADDGHVRFRHALLREAVYDDLLPGERCDLHASLAVALESRRVGGGDEPGLVGEIARHYSAAGDQPAALRASVEAALEAREIRAFGEAAALAERALELWPRVPEAAASLPVDRVDVLQLAARSHSIAGDRARAEMLLRQALDELDPDGDSERVAGVLAYLARMQWNLNRGAEAIETAHRALELLPDGSPSVERVRISGWLARTRFLRGKFRSALEYGEEALADAIACGDQEAEGEILNTLGMTQVALGDVDGGVRRLRQAIQIGRDNDDLDSVGYGYANLADMLSLAGRPAEAFEVAREGLGAIPRRMTGGHDWMMLTVSTLAFEAGDWQAAREHLEGVPDRQQGILLIFRLLREAELALGVGDEELAQRALEQAEPLVANSSEPQWIGTFGSLNGELWRRRRDLVAARAAVQQALDCLELCTDDVMRVARLSAVGVRVEADIALRARDLRERSEERDAVVRARLHVDRLRAAAQEGGPVERAWHAIGKAELARARGAGRGRGGLWEAAASEWERIGRPYETALARWRAAEAFVEEGSRDAAAASLGSSLGICRRFGAAWLEGEVLALAARARLNLEADNGSSSSGRVALAVDGDSEQPFGLTPRERQVLSLIAQGATNRQIGNALFMAEKTASVHVSRILGKLGVQTRTQAAAVAHRLHIE